MEQAWCPAGGSIADRPGQAAGPSSRRAAPIDPGSHGPQQQDSGEPEDQWRLIWDEVEGEKRGRRGLVQPPSLMDTKERWNSAMGPSPEATEKDDAVDGDRHRCWRRGI